MFTDIFTNSQCIAAARSADSHWDLLPITTGEDCTPTPHPCSLSQPWAFINTHTSLHCYCTEPFPFCKLGPYSLKMYSPAGFMLSQAERHSRLCRKKVQSENHQGFHWTDAAVSGTGRLSVLDASPTSCWLHGGKRWQSQCLEISLYFAFCVNRSSQHVIRPGPTLLSFGEKKVARADYFTITIEVL